MEILALINFLSSQIITLIERDDGNKKKQRMEKETWLSLV